MTWNTARVMKMNFFVASLGIQTMTSSHPPTFEKKLLPADSSTRNAQVEDDSRHVNQLEISGLVDFVRDAQLGTAQGSSPSPAA